MSQRGQVDAETLLQLPGLLPGQGCGGGLGSGYRGPADWYHRGLRRVHLTATWAAIGINVVNATCS